jgi:hypothetical protein
VQVVVEQLLVELGDGLEQVDARARCAVRQVARDLVLVERRALASSCR